MDTLLQIYTLADKASIAQMVVALFSALLLLLAYQSQLESSRLNRDIAELDQRAKRAQYLPKLKCKLNDVTTVEEDGYGGTFKNFDKPWKYEVRIGVKNNSMLLNDIKVNNNIYGKQAFSYNQKYETNAVFTEDNGLSIIVTYVPNDLRSQCKDIQDNVFEMTIFYSDLIGNSYMQKIDLVDGETKMHRLYKL